MSRPRPQLAEGRPGAAAYLMSQSFIHLISLQHNRSQIWSSLENHQARQIYRFLDQPKIGHSLLASTHPIKENAPHLKVVQVGIRHFHDFPVTVENCQDPPGWICWTCRPSSIIDRHEIQPLVFFEKSGFFGWNQGIQQFSSARKILRKTWTSSFTKVSSHIHTQPVLGCRPLNQPGSPGDSPS